MNRDVDDEKYNFTIVRLEKNRVHVYICMECNQTRQGKGTAAQWQKLFDLKIKEKSQLRYDASV